MGDVIGLRFDGGALRVEVVDGAALPGPTEEQAAQRDCATLSTRALVERRGEAASIAAKLTRAIGHVVP